MTPISTFVPSSIEAMVEECPESLLKNELGDFAAFYEKAMGGGC